MYDDWIRSVCGNREAADVRRDLHDNLAEHVAALVATYMPYDEGAVHQLERLGVLQPDLVNVAESGMSGRQLPERG